MKLNCKPGDLAVVMRSFQGNEGRIVRCIRLVQVRWERGEECPTWEIYPPLQNVVHHARTFCPDFQLRPIRDPGDDARDESLSWLPVPSREEVTV